jgi:hypothetical protein
MELRHKFHDFLRGILEQGIAEGTFDPDMNTSVVVNSLFLLINTTHRWYRPTGPVSPRALIEWYKTFVLRGVAADGAVEGSTPGPARYAARRGRSR